MRWLDFISNEDIKKMMSRLLLGAIAGLIVFVFLVANAFAHPGRTAKDGCHFCKTNCKKWGYTTGTRHGHKKNVRMCKFGPLDPIFLKNK